MASPDDYHHPMDIEEFRRRGHEMVDFIADYYRDIEKFPVRSIVEPGYLAVKLPTAAPEKAETFEAVMKDVGEHIVPGITHWQHPSYFAYFSANSSFPAMLGDMLSTAFNVIGFSWVTSPACTELETIVLDWLGKLYGLPEDFLSSSGKGGGVIQGTASEAVVVAILSARSRVVEKLVADGATVEEVVPKLVAICSDQAHSSVAKACRIIGLSLAQVHTIKVHPGTDFSMDPADLAAAISEIKRAGNIPFFCVATVGTTSSTAIDPLEKLGPILNEEGVWMHVDAAFAGSACVCPEMQWLFNGIHHADSLCTNPHKWMLVNFDCSALWLKDRVHTLNAMSINPEYLRNKTTDTHLGIDYRNWQLPLGRRFRALKLWMVLRMYGAEGIREYIRHHLDLAAQFEDMVAKDPDFEIVAPRSVSLVCFRLKGPREHNERLMESVNSSGKMFLTHTVLPGDVYCLRMAISTATTQISHVTAAWELLREKASVIRKSG